MVKVVSVLCYLPASFRTHFLRDFRVILSVGAGSLDHFFAITNGPALAMAIGQHAVQPQLAAAGGAEGCEKGGVLVADDAP